MLQVVTVYKYLFTDKMDDFLESFYPDTSSLDECLMPFYNYIQDRELRFELLYHANEKNSLYKWMIKICKMKKLKTQLDNIDMKMKMVFNLMAKKNALEKQSAPLSILKEFRRFVMSQMQHEDMFFPHYEEMPTLKY